MSEAINLTAIILSIIALIISIISGILVLALKFSTHKIEFKPLTFSDLEEKAVEDELIQESDEDTLDKAKELQKKARRTQDPLDDILSTSNF